MKFRTVLSKILSNINKKGLKSKLQPFFVKMYRINYFTPAFNTFV
ncbi:hypothetical protein Runsl_4602 [Runella slithyformis DSM 19594]|uniref:Uncharacterized protein n=1 Tax=Runella slithyformis (strain ATCC 29530 / DSM 19594 / LMG 11500 / NCIMB 11436 / LSU 4) TaxID=761193 RepID=A0A7U3ZPD8_RUNSL|nr:hypothetical protein Runsl_4602 [Runella slithyformis DSM 19594]